MQLAVFSSLAVLLLSRCLSALVVVEKGDNPNNSHIEKRGAWDYETSITRGLNLGGWFVLEPYITPSLFGSWLSPVNTPPDEYHLTKQLGKKVAQLIMEQHWSSWYTEADFKDISLLGINVVRIPIGYWAFQLLPDDPYVQGQVKYFDLALQWARKYNLKVWVDLHGAPGSQNGFDNSGLRDKLEWQTGNNTQITLNVLNTIFEKYGGTEYSDVVIGIELLNEPLGTVLDIEKIKQFYQDGYNALRKTGSTTPVIIHDAFLPIGSWNDFLTVDKNAWSVVLDHHHYQVFTAGEIERTIDQHISVACNWGWDTKKEYHWTVAGEWSAALNDCAFWLNGVGRGARYEGKHDNAPYMGSCAPYLDIATWPEEHKTNVRRYIEAQLDAFEYNGGWIFWNWKTESAGDWDFQRLTSHGLFPQPLDERKFPNQCNFPNRK
ncbi:hypothetical protein KGF56_004847 [Candida oxycetoniae]|uniref:Glucan 1,3-beta-glucosidase n=1 Tax=Candida oxycetoniae TaxID=497107 RepID=A0AAI9ST85_9ASCO|nr:uncharacterized protein KGF56_004847 [Candida oxycetoniae]KAI3402439.1 hypothetical protein KGF56_004847 [Candida oxycetoniae]